MVIDNWHNFNHYLPQLPYAQIIREYISSHKLDDINNFKKLPLGKIDIKFPQVFIIHDKYQTQNASDKLWESHRKYLDIQLIISGTESMWVASINQFLGLIAKDYSDERDIIFYNHNLESINEDYLAKLEMSTQSFSVFFPQDAHLPGISPDGKAGEVEKIVFKVLVSQ